MVDERDGKGWYNGYSWKEREDKFKKQTSTGQIAVGPCALCGDPDAKVEYHEEDYSQPYSWDAPAAYCVCRHCHLHKIHSRFTHPIAWTAFLAHVRRGGYASDLIKPDVKIEVEALKSALKKGERIALATLRPYKGHAGDEWFSLLTLDRGSLTSPSSRPRP